MDWDLIVFFWFSGASYRLSYLKHQFFWSLDLPLITFGYLFLVYKPSFNMLTLAFFICATFFPLISCVVKPVIPFLYLILDGKWGNSWCETKKIDSLLDCSTHLELMGKFLMWMMLHWTMNGCQKGEDTQLLLVESGQDTQLLYENFVCGLGSCQTTCYLICPKFDLRVHFGVLRRHQIHEARQCISLRSGICWLSIMFRGTSLGLWERTF